MFKNSHNFLKYVQITKHYDCIFIVSFSVNPLLQVGKLFYIFKEVIHGFLIGATNTQRNSVSSLIYEISINKNVFSMS